MSQEPWHKVPGVGRIEIHSPRRHVLTMSGNCGQSESLADGIIALREISSRVINGNSRVSAQAALDALADERTVQMARRIARTHGPLYSYDKRIDEIVATALWLERTCNDLTVNSILDWAQEMSRGVFRLKELGKAVRSYLENQEIET